MKIKIENFIGRYIECREYRKNINNYNIWIESLQHDIEVLKEVSTVYLKKHEDLKTAFTMKIEMLKNQIANWEYMKQQETKRLNEKSNS